MLASPTVIAKRTECVPCVTVSFSKSSEVHLELLQVFDYFSLSKQAKLFHGSPVAPAASVSNLVSFDAASFRCYASARLFRTSQPTTGSSRMDLGIAALSSFSDGTDVQRRCLHNKVRHADAKRT